MGVDGGRGTPDREGILRAVPSPQLVLDPHLPAEEFLQRLSHELRTPLNAVLGFAQLLELEGLEPQQTRQVGQILRGGRELLELVNELLEISRIEAGTLRMSLSPVPLAQVVRKPGAGRVARRRALDPPGGRPRRT